MITLDVTVRCYNGQAPTEELVDAMIEDLDKRQQNRGCSKIVDERYSLKSYDDGQIRFTIFRDME